MSDNDSNVSPELLALADDVLNMLERGVQASVLTPASECEWVIVSSRGRHIRALRAFNLVKDAYDYRFDQLSDDAVKAAQP